jgi:hypothetical protein
MDGRDLRLLADGSGVVVLDADLVSLLKVSIVDIPGQPHLAPLGQLEQTIVFLTQTVILGKTHLIRGRLPVSNFHPDATEVALIHHQ